MIYVKSSISFRDFFHHDHFFSYFKIQSLASLIYLGSGLAIKADLVHFSDFKRAYLTVIITLSIIAKLGVPPFHSWTYKFVPSVSSWYCCFLFFTFQKIYLYSIISYVSPLMTLVVIIMCLIVGSFFLFTSSSLIDILISSSIFNSFWFLVFNLYSNSMVYIFFLIYSSSILFFCKNFRADTNSKLKVFFSLAILALPPFSVFFMKTRVIIIFSEAFTTFELIFISIFLFIGLCGYVKYFGLIYSEHVDNKTGKNIRIFGFLLPLVLLVFFFF